MPGTYKRASDKERGKSGKWTCWWYGADGKRKSCRGTTDRAESDRIARERESEARLVREGLVDPADRKRRESALRSVADHVEDYRLDLLAKGGTHRHARHVAGVLNRLLDNAGIASVADLATDLIQAALGRLKAKGRSARTVNHAIGSIKAFSAWLADSKRITEVPSGLKKIRALDQNSDRRHVRRALTKEEIVRLLDAAEQGETITREVPTANPARKSTRGGDGTKGRGRKVPITGPDRAALYRLAIGTGFRANELRSLTPESFHLEGDEPFVRLAPEIEKNRKGTDQPILADLAAFLFAFLEGKPPGKPIIPVPEKTAQMLRHDLQAAGIAYRTHDGVADFHAIRASYITHLIESGANPRIVQILARHSTVTLTLERYVKHTKQGLRDALTHNKGD